MYILSILEINLNSQILVKLRIDDWQVKDSVALDIFRPFLASCGSLFYICQNRLVHAQN